MQAWRPVLVLNSKKIYCINSFKFLGLKTILNTKLCWNTQYTTHIQWHSTCIKPVKLGQEFQNHLMFPRTSLQWHQCPEHWPITSKAKAQEHRWNLPLSLGWKFSINLSPAFRNYFQPPNNVVTHTIKIRSAINSLLTIKQNLLRMLCTRVQESPSAFPTVLQTVTSEPLSALFSLGIYHQCSLASSSYRKYPTSYKRENWDKKN